MTTGEPPGWPRSGPGWRPFRWDRRADVVVATVTGLVQVGGTALAVRHQADARPLDGGGVLLLLAGSAALAVRRRWPVPVLGVAFTAALGYVLLDYPGGPIWASLIVAFGTAVATGRRRAAYVSLAAGYVGFLWLPSLVSGRPAPSAWAAVGLAAWLAVLLAMSELVRSRRAYRQASRQRAVEAERSREEQARRRASEERLGIARELHDVLAHSISLINVQAGVALELIDRRPEQVRTALAAIKQASRDALVEVQSVLDALRQAGERAPRAPAAGLSELDRLVGRAESAGLAVRVRTSGQPVALPAGADLAAYRIVQEALTNVVRHAAATTVTVGVRYGREAVTVEVDDDGRSYADGAGATGGPGGGRGIAGMRERAAALGGKLCAGPKPGGGFRVRARLPLADPGGDGAR